MAKAKPTTKSKVREVQTIPIKGGLFLRPLSDDRYGVMLTTTAPVTVINADQVEKIKTIEFPKSYEVRLKDKIKAIRRILTDEGIIKSGKPTPKKDK